MAAERPTTIFLADSHLRGPQDPNQRCLVDFLRARRNSEVVLVGDIFEYLAGRNRAAEAAYAGVFQALAACRRLDYFEGNHDFDLGPDLPGLAGARFWPGPGLLDKGGIPVWVSHGDRASPGDLGTKLLRYLLQSRPIRSLRDRWLPQQWLFDFALHFADWSRQGIWPGRRREAWHARQLAWRQALGAGARVVVFAHTHHAELSRQGPLLVANPGPAVVGGSYLELAAGRLSLRRLPTGEMLPPGPLAVEPV